jgi:hypothetical protein
MTYSTLQYLLDDYPRTLFPLSTTLVVLQNSEKAVSEYIYQKVIRGSESEYSFLSQTRCFASKHGLHLRRTVKLDPVAEYFIYDLVYRNRTLFRKDFSTSRRSFGYRFEDGKPILPSSSYGEFRRAVLEAKGRYRCGIKFDVATYFNSLYHHDLVAWLSGASGRQEDVDAFGQFLREVNTGRSVDCLPQGIHPCKVIGAEFLKFIDNSMQLRAKLLLRFMDDVYLFDDDETMLNSDFITVQRLLGEKGLSLNASKTAFGEVGEMGIAEEVDDIKRGLLQVRRQIIEVSGDVFEGQEEVVYGQLGEEQIEYLLNLLKNPDIDEADAELVLVLLRDHGKDVLEHMQGFLERFPSLSRNVYNFSRYILEHEDLSGLLLSFVKTGQNVTEDQLFWIAKIAEEYLSKTKAYAELLMALYEHPRATTVTRAKVLEIPETRFGMSALRDEHLKVGRSDWLAWAAAAGTRRETAISRNHLLSYFSKASQMNRIIGECVKALP